VTAHRTVGSAIAPVALTLLGAAIIACGGGSSSKTPTSFAADTISRSATAPSPSATTARAPATVPAAVATQAPAVDVTFVSPPTAVPTIRPTPSAAAAEICASNAVDVITGTVQTPELKEISGMAVSLHHPGVIWVHNDSGDTARFFALDTQGALLATYNLPGVEAVDWEDMAILHTAREDELLFGDVGDNASVRPGVVVYEVQEPDPARDGPGEHDVEFTTIHLSYPDGPHNAESLVMDPKPVPGRRDRDEGHHRRTIWCVRVRPRVPRAARSAPISAQARGRHPVWFVLAGQGGGGRIAAASVRARQDPDWWRELAEG
jgi:hypothetical protein